MNMFIILMVLTVSVVLTVVIGSILGASTRRGADDSAQAEYLSRWSDVKRLRKQG